MLRRVKLCDLDLDRAHFHFTKTIDLSRIEKNNLTSDISASLAMADNTKRIHFSTGISNILKYHDVYLKWLMNNMYGEKSLRKKYDDDVFNTKMYEWTKEFLNDDYKSDQYKKNAVFTKYYHDMLECMYLVINVSNACDYNKDELEAFLIAKDIKDKINNSYQIFDKDTGILRNSTYSDFVILMDRTSCFDLYKRIFLYLGIPLELYKDETMNNDQDIIVLNNLIKLIIKTNNKIYDKELEYLFTSVMRSFLINSNDEEIFEKVKKEGIPLHIFPHYSTLYRNIEQKGVF